MKLSFDDIRFQRDVRKLASLTNKSLTTVLDEQARLFVRDCVRATPPFTPGKNWTEKFEIQQNVGKLATAGQVQSLFRPLSDIKVIKEISMGSKGRLGRSLRKLIREGRANEAVTLLNKLKITASSIEVTASSKSHNKVRDRRGRVRKPKANRIFVINGASIKPFVERKTENVGLAKSGWAQAAKGLKLGLPRWIKRHRGPGVFLRSGNPESPAVTVGNSVPFIQRTAQELGILNWALKNRYRNAEKQVERTLRAQLRARGVKVK